MIKRPVILLLIMLVTTWVLAAEEFEAMSLTTLTAAAETWMKTGSTIASLSHYDGKKVALRGFLCHSDEGVWSLASQPSLRSCCLNGKNRACLQVILDGPFEVADIGKAVTMSGTLSVNIAYDADGSVSRIYQLGQGILMVQDKPFPWLALVVVIVAVALLLWRRKS